MKRSIVILHPGALGDVLLAVPAIRRLGARFPHHERLLIARASVSRLLSECRIVDEWMALERQECAGLLSGPALISGKLRSWLKRCDLAVAWTDDHDGTLACVLPQCGARKACIQSPFSSVLSTVHQSDRFLETVGEAAGHAPSGDTVQIPRSCSEQGKAYLESRGITPDQPLVLVHPGSGSIHKCLEPRRVALLIQQLSRGGMYPLILEGPADQDAVDHALQFMSEPVPVLRDLDISQLAGLLAQVRLYIGHDSGVTHLSVLLGVPTIALFGPTDPNRWAPRGSHVTILRGSHCICESPEIVKNCVEKRCLQVSLEEILIASRHAIEKKQCKPS